MNMEETISAYVTEQQPLYILFAGKIQELICSILKANGVTPHSVTAREKSANSLKEKILREGKEYENPLREVTDLAAVRIITYFPKDVDRVIPLLEKDFAVDKDNSVDKRKVADPTVFGYASVHLIVELTEQRCILPEYAIFRGLKCEIQVRTILQHAWAEIEHDIAYKSSEEIPFELRRKFASLAGLLEVADREFELLRHEQKKVREQIEKTIKREELDVAVNLDSLSLYLTSYHNEKLKRLNKIGPLVKLLNKLKIESLQQLHEILTPAALKRSDAETAIIRDACAGADECLLRYFIAIGEHAKLSRRRLSVLTRCPALADPKEYKKRRMTRHEEFKTVRGRMGGEENVPNQASEVTARKRAEPQR